MELQTQKLGKVSITVDKDYWNINKEYDRLTIVEVAGAATTYLSRKDVPAGTEISNREYWIKFGKFPDSVIEPVQELGDNEDAIVSQKVVTQKLNELNNDIQTLETITNEKVNEVSNYANDIQSAIAMLSPEQQEAIGVATEVVKTQNQLGGHSIRTLSEEEYQSLAANEALDDNTLYFIEEEEDEET